MHAILWTIADMLTRGQAEMIRWIKSNYPQIDVVGGNVVTSRQAAHLIAAVRWKHAARIPRLASAPNVGIMHKVSCLI